MPMADLEVVFPYTTASLRPLDIITFTITVCIGIISVIVNMQTDSSNFGSLTFLGFLGLAAKSGYDYWNLMYYYRGLIMDILFGRFLDSHSGVISNVMTQVRYQELKEASLAYAFLSSEEFMTEDQVLTKVNQFLQEISPENSNVHFECDDAIRKLLEMELVVEKENGLFRAIDNRSAIETLRNSVLKMSQD